MERVKKRSLLSAVTALAMLAACTGGGSGEAPPPADDDGAWMDTALVRVVQDTAAGRETVTLVDEASGRSQQMSDEELADDVIEVEDSQ